MNIGEMHTEVRERLGEDEENFWSDTAVYRALNQAVQRFSHAHRWPWLIIACSFSVAEGDTEIELPDDVDFNRNYNLRLVPTDGNERYAVAPERVLPDRANDLRTTYASGSASLQPRYYYLDHRVINTYTAGYIEDGAGSDTARAIGASIRIIPAADRDYDGEVRYFRNVRLIASDAAEPFATPDCPIQYHDAIVALATGNLWLKELNGGQKAQEMFNIYNSILDQALSDAVSIPEDGLLVWGGEAPRNRQSSGFSGSFGPNGYGYLGWPDGEPSNT